MPNPDLNTQSQIIRLHFAPGTRAVRARWMLEELGVDYRLNVVDLRQGAHKSDAHKKLHPLGKVPALEIDGTVIFESLAILLYLADRFWEKDLAPVAEKRMARADYLTLMAFSIGTLEPSVLDRMREHKAAEKGIETIDLGPALTSFDGAAQHIEDSLANRSFLLGDQLTAADIMNGSMMIWADKMGLLTGYPETKRWIERLISRPAYQRATSK